MKIIVRQISIVSNPDCTFYLKLEWAKEFGAGFVILLCDAISAWSGEVSEDDMTRESQDMEMTREKYVHDLQLALTGEGQAAQSYVFHLAPEKSGGPMLQLSYEKVQSDISFRLGMVELLPVPGSTKVIRELISYGLEHNVCLRAKNHHLHKENQRLRNEQEHIAAEMERYVRGKETLEKSLYSHFVLVLNEKKAKIRALQNTIKKLQDTVEDEKQRRERSTGSGEIALADSKAEKSDYGSTTDEEGEKKDQTFLKFDAKVFASNPMDDSLNDITDVAPSRKRRHRHLQQLESQTKRPAVEHIQSLSVFRNELPEKSKGEVRNAPVQVSPDPDDLYDDI